MSKKIDLPTNIQELQSFLKTAIEHYQGSPVKNNNKLNEATAIGLNIKNWDTLSGILNKVTYPIHACWDNDNNIVINGEVINDEIFQECEAEYTLSYREDRISDLITWISECQNGDKILMIEDLKYLLSINDDFVFDSISTNRFVAASDNVDEFNEICNDILELNKKYN